MKPVTATRIPFLFTSLNAELGRNLLKEFTLHRMIAPPIILGMLYLISMQFDRAGVQSNHSYLFSSLTGWILFATLLVWGCRRSAASLLEEVDERTWDFQRLSQLSPVQLVTGKLFGSVSYAWYIAFTALIMQVVIGQSLSAPQWSKISAWLLAGFSGQAAALMMALVSVPERRRGYKGMGVGLSQLTGVLYGVTVYCLYKPLPLEFRYFGFTMPYLAFYWLNACVFLGWLLAGCVRLMRRELQYPCYPWVWTAYLVYLALHIYGIEVMPPDWMHEGGQSGLVAQPEIPLEWQTGLSVFNSWKPYLLLLSWSMLGFWSMLADDKDPKLFSELAYYLRQKQWGRLLQRLPGWMIAVGFALLLAVSLAMLGVTPLSGGSEVLGEMAVKVPALALASMLFLLRDIEVIWWFFLAPKRGRAMLGAMIYLFVLYSIVPWLLGLLHAPGWLMGFFVPWNEQGEVFIWPIAVECLLLLGLLRRRYVQLFTMS